MLRACRDWCRGQWFHLYGLWKCRVYGEHLWLKAYPQRGRVEFCPRCRARRQWADGEWVPLPPVGAKQKTRAVR